MDFDPVKSQAEERDDYVYGITEEERIEREEERFWRFAEREPVTHAELRRYMQRLGW